MGKSLIWRAIGMVFSTNGVLAAVGAVGMLMMHQRMMGGLGLC